MTISKQFAGRFVAALHSPRCARSGIWYAIVLGLGALVVVACSSSVDGGGAADSGVADRRDDEPAASGIAGGSVDVDSESFVAFTGIEEGVWSSDLGDVGWRRIVGAGGHLEVCDTETGDCQDGQVVPNLSSVVLTPGGYRGIEDLAGEGFLFWASAEGESWAVIEPPLAEALTAEVHSTDVGFWLSTSAPFTLWRSDDGDSWEAVRISDLPSNLAEGTNLSYRIDPPVTVGDTTVIPVQQVMAVPLNEIFEAGPDHVVGTNPFGCALPDDGSKQFGLDDYAADEVPVFRIPASAERTIGRGESACEHLATLVVETTATEMQLRDVDSNEIVFELGVDEGSVSSSQWAEILRGGNGLLGWDTLSLVGDQVAGFEVVDWPAQSMRLTETLTGPAGFPAVSVNQLDALGESFAWFVSSGDLSSGGPTTTEMWSSTDGKTWAQLPEPPFANEPEPPQVCGSGKRLFVCTDNQSPILDDQDSPVWVSDDGTTWDRAHGFGPEYHPSLPGPWLGDPFLHDLFLTAGAGLFYWAPEFGFVDEDTSIGDMNLAISNDGNEWHDVDGQSSAIAMLELENDAMSLSQVSVLAWPTAAGAVFSMYDSASDLRELWFVDFPVAP